MIQILANGSKWMGQSPDPVEVLLEMLSRHTLNPMFETHGNFIIEKPPTFIPDGPVEGTIYGFFGNFYDVSHVFDLYTDETELIHKLITAIRKNQMSIAYLEARQCQRKS